MSNAIQKKPDRRVSTGRFNADVRHWSHLILDIDSMGRLSFGTFVRNYGYMKTLKVLFIIRRREKFGRMWILDLRFFRLILSWGLFYIIAIISVVVGVGTQYLKMFRVIFFSEDKHHSR